MRWFLEGTIIAIGLAAGAALTVASYSEAEAITAPLDRAGMEALMNDVAAQPDPVCTWVKKAEAAWIGVDCH